MTLQFPIPQFIGEAVRYEGGTWVWDGVGWHVDQTANRLDLSMVPAYLGQFVHIVPSTPPTFISLAAPDVYGATFVLAATPPLQGIKVYKNGELLILDDGSGFLGHYVVNRAANRIEFLVPLVVNDVITIGVLMPSETLAPGRVDVEQIKDLDTDWVTNPSAPTTGMVNGVRRIFDLLVDTPAGQSFAVVGEAIELGVFVGGLRQRPGIDFTTVGSRLTMTVAPVAGVPFWALWYRPAGSGSGGAIAPPQPPLDGRQAYYGWRPGDGASWQDARGVAITVADAAARAALRPDIELVAGRLVHQADTQELWRWTGAAWVRYLDAGTFTAPLGGRVQVLRSTTALARPAPDSGLPGELWVNIADRTIGAFDGGNDPVELMGLDANGFVDPRFFSPGLRPYGTVDPGSILITDWNDAHLNGTTVVRAAAGAPNRPPGPDLAYAGHYTSMGSADVGFVTAFSPQGDTVYVRPRTGGAWGSWIQVNSPGLDISSAMLRVNNLNDVNSKPAGRTNLEVLFNPRAVFAGDLNALDETGLYPLGIGVTNGWTNDGTGAGGEATVGDAVLHIETGGSLAYQLGFNVIPAGPAAKPLRMRFMTGPTTWTPWASVSTSAEVTTQINAAIAAAVAALPPGTAAIGPTAPPAPVAGQFWYDTTVPGLFVFRTDTDPDRWEQTWLDPEDPPPGTHVGDAPPPTPEQGQLWFRTIDPVGLFVWYVDVDSSQWVSVGGSGGGGGGGEPTSVEIVQGNTGWQVVGDQLICWGSAVSGTGGNTPITFPREFKTPPAIGTTPRNNDGTATRSVITTFTNKTTTSVNLTTENSGGFAAGIGVDWIAIAEALDADKMPKEVQIPGGGGGGGGGVPVGTVSFFAANQVPPGWLLCNNQRVTTVYPDLRQYLLDAGSPYGSVGGDPRVPELRGEFIRGHSAGRAGVDDGRVFGSAQGDAIRNITGQFGISGATFGAMTRDSGNTLTGPFAQGTPKANTVMGTNVAGADLLFDASLQVPTANENRPRNVALLPCIKAFSEVLVEGQANFGIATDPEVKAGTRNDVVLTPANVRSVAPYVLIADGVVSAPVTDIPFFIPSDVEQVEFYQQGLVGTLSSANADVGMQYGTGPEGAPVWIAGATDYFAVISVNSGTGTISPTFQSRNHMQVATLTDAANAKFSAGRGTFFGFNAPDTLAHALIDTNGVTLPSAGQVLRFSTRIGFTPVGPLTHLRLRAGAGSLASGRYKLIGVR